MTIPSFSRIEIRHDTPFDLRQAATGLRDLADELDGIAEHPDAKIRRIAAHHAIREVSGKLRSAPEPVQPDHAEDAHHN